MADDKPKKTKINLKDRLGQKAGGGAAPGVVPVPMPGGATPPPPALGDDGGRPSAPSSSPSAPAPAAAASVPAPMARPSGGGIAPPMGLSPGIPLPPFGQKRQAEAPAKATAAQQTIKVELGEEVVQERKKLAKRTALYVVLTAIVFFAVGVPVGSTKEKGDRGKLAIEGAAALEKDVKAANEKLKELEEKIAAGAQKLGEKKFPDELVKDLGAVNIPFDATNLEGKQVGSLPGKVLRMVLNYTSNVQDVNKQKDALKNVLTAAQAPVTKAWKEEKEPVVNFALLFQKKGENFTAEMVPVKEPFPFGKDFPKDFKVTTIQQGKAAEKSVTKFTGGKQDLVGGESPAAIAMDPKSTAAFSSDAIVGRLSKALLEIREELGGRKDDPTKETAGLLVDGKILADELHKISLAR